MTRVARAFSIVALIVLFGTAPAWAQATAELNGRVTDSSGAVLPGVTVTATQTATGLVRTVVTDGDGNYLVSNLPTGPYRLEVSLQGFKSYVQTGLVLTVGATPTVNAALELGSLEETVTVEAAAPLVDVRSAGISSVVENERIVELPLQGRQVTDLLVLSGAAVQTDRATARVMPGGVKIAVAGGLETGVGYTLDGATHNNPQENVNLPLPFPDALQEFRVATSGLSAQNGFKSAAAVNAVTKSGTNRFSGNAFEFLRHHRFNATSPFASIGPDGERNDDGLKRNQFGGTLGGPILRDRLFFFGAYQGTPTRRSPPSNIAFVPTPAMLAGDFTAFTSPACNGGRQVALRAPYVNNQINPALFSPAAHESGQATAEYDRPVRPDHVRRQRGFRRGADARQDRLSDRDQALLLRPVPVDHLQAGSWIRRRHRQHPQDLLQGIGHVVPLDDLRRDHGAQLVDGQRPAGGGQHRQGRRLPDPVLLTEGHRREPLLLRTGVHDGQRPPQLPHLRIEHGQGAVSERHVPAGRGPDDRAGQPSVRRRRQPELLRGRPHVHVALERELDHQRFRHRIGDRRPARRPRDQCRARRSQQGARQQLAHGVVCAGLVACVEPRDRQRRRAVGAVLRPERREQRDRDLQDGEFPAGDQEQGVPQRAGRPDLSGGRRLSAGTDGVGRPVVEHRAPPRCGVGCPRRWPPRGALVVLHGL